MRFGQDFHRYQVPEWASSYLPYGSLKSMLNKAVREAKHKKSIPDFTGVLLSLERGIDTISKFHDDKDQFLHRREDEIGLNFGLPLERHEASIAEHLDCCQLQELLSAVMEVSNDFKKLQWYYRVNAEAVNRIYSKVERNALPGQLREYQSKWVERKADRDARCERHAETLRNLIADIRCSLLLAGSRSTRNATPLKSLRGQSPQTAISCQLRCAVLEDQPSELDTLLKKLSLDQGAGNPRFRELVYELAQLSLTYGSKQSVDFLLLEAFKKYGVEIDNSILNDMISHLGRSGTLEGHDEVQVTSLCSHRKRCDEAISRCFSHAVQQLDRQKRNVFLAKDVVGRTCLHYGALYGLQGICQSVLESSLVRDMGYASLVLLVDSQRYTPLHYAIINNHTVIADMFLTALDMESVASSQNATTLATLLDELLFIAIRYEYTDLIHLLSKRHSSHEPSIEGETALHVAAQTGNEKTVDVLLKTGWVEYLDAPETVRGWTPLFIACAQGHQAVTKLLLKAGARQDIVDYMGWTAKEHAALRGHLTVAEMLDPWDTISHCRSSIPVKPVSKTQAPLLPDCSHVIVSLGAIQRGSRVKAVVLNPSQGYTPTSGSLALEVSVSEGSVPSRAVELPILNDMVNEPFIFPVSDPDKSWLAFRLYRAGSLHAEGQRELLGSGVALLRGLSDCFGTHRESLLRERTIPILEKDTLSVLGTVTFTFLIARPMTALNVPRRETRMSTTSSLQLVGHRGLGQNTANRSYLQLGENTIESFRSAAKQGATYVEFDVQLTRDLVPVVYHDFSLSESGTDIPIHDLTVEQFMHASKLQLPRNGPVPGPGTQDAQRPLRGRRTHSQSLTGDSGPGAEIRDRMAHTVDFRNKGFKPNTRGDFIQGSFATLEDVLTRLPESIGLNIEIKYPRPHEAAEAGVAPVAIEINTFIDKILEKILQHASNRTIILSSFTPEICILLAFKQQVYPVMFITNAGKPPVTDLEARASSLKAAVRFAHRWGLAGVVFASETLVCCPRLIGYVKQSGLVCGSYGLLNNVPENAKVQAAAGIDILMADRVGLISGALGDGGFL